MINGCYHSDRGGDGAQEAVAGALRELSFSLICDCRDGGFYLGVHHSQGLRPCLVLHFCAGFTFSLVHVTWLEAGSGSEGLLPHYSAGFALISYGGLHPGANSTPPKCGQGGHADNGCLSLPQRQRQGPSWLHSPKCMHAHGQWQPPPQCGLALRPSLPTLSAPSELGAPPGPILPFPSSPLLQLLWATLPWFSLIPFVFLSELTHNFYFTKDILSCFPILYIKLFCHFGGMKWEWAIKTCTKCGIIIQSDYNQISIDHWSWISVYYSPHLNSPLGDWLHKLSWESIKLASNYLLDLTTKFQEIWKIQQIK